MEHKESWKENHQAEIDWRRPYWCDAHHFLRDIHSAPERRLPIITDGHASLSPLSLYSQGTYLHRPVTLTCSRHILLQLWHRSSKGFCISFFGWRPRRVYFSTESFIRVSPPAEVSSFLRGSGISDRMSLLVMRQAICDAQDNQIVPPRLILTDYKNQ